MNRVELSRMETQLHLLLKKYKNLQEQQFLMQKEIKEKDIQLGKKQSMINDLKNQLNDLTKFKPKKNQNEIQFESKEIQAKVLELIEQIDDCIKAIE